jgi:hypothetical protein
MPYSFLMTETKRSHQPQGKQKKITLDSIREKRLWTLKETGVYLNTGTARAAFMARPGGPLHHARIEMGPRQVRMDARLVELFILGGGLRSADPGDQPSVSPAVTTGTADARV